MIVMASIGAMMILAACDSKFGFGGSRAERFVKDEVLRGYDDVRRVEVVDEDSLLCDEGLMFMRNEALRKRTAYYEGAITKDSLERFLDGCMEELVNVSNSWNYGVMPKNIEKYSSQLRRVYTVKVTMDTGKTKKLRVLMDHDGTTPRTTEQEFLEELNSYIKDFDIGDID